MVLRVGVVASKGHGPQSRSRGHQWKKVSDRFCALWQEVTTDTYQSLLYQYVMPWLSATYLEGNILFQQDVPQLTPQIQRRDSLGPTWLCAVVQGDLTALIAGLCLEHKTSQGEYHHPPKRGLSEAYHSAGMGLAKQGNDSEQPCWRRLSLLGGYIDDIEETIPK
jgi:hypothetical protein